MKDLTSILQKSNQALQSLLLYGHVALHKEEDFSLYLKTASLNRKTLRLPWRHSICLSWTSSMINLLSLWRFSKTKVAKELANTLSTPIKSTWIPFKWSMAIVGLSLGGGVLDVRGIGSSGFLHDGASVRVLEGGSSIVSVMSSQKKHSFWSHACWKDLKMFNLIFIFPKEIFITPVQQLMHSLAMARKGRPRKT